MRKSNTIENTLNTEHHVHAILLLATQGLAFRGHDKSQDSFHRGNFVKLLKNFQYYSGNKPLAECLFKPTHPTFSGLSSDIQNNLILSLHDEVMHAIKVEIQISLYLSLIADESTDITNNAQLAVCLRYTNKGRIQERLVDLVDVSVGKSADELSSAIKASLKKVITEDTKVIGQSYDGAANMAGCNNSVQTHNQKDWQYATFVHCYAHKLALVIKCACKDVKCAADSFESVSNICNFFRSSPKQGCLLSIA